MSRSSPQTSSCARRGTGRGPIGIEPALTGLRCLVDACNETGDLYGHAAEPTYQEQTFPTIDEAEEAAVREDGGPASPEPNVNGRARRHQAARCRQADPGETCPVRLRGERVLSEGCRDGAYPDLAPVVPASYTADQVRERLGDQFGPAGDALDDRRHLHREHHVRLEPAEDPGRQDRQVDHEFRENKAQQEKSSWDAGVKSFKFALGIDPMTGSTQRGWRIVAGTDASGIRVLDGMQSQSILSKFSEDPAVWDQLIGKMQDIRNAAARSDLGFIAASVFSVHGTRTGKPRWTPDSSTSPMRSTREIPWSRPVPQPRGQPAPRRRAGRPRPDATQGQVPEPVPCRDGLPDQGRNKVPHNEDCAGDDEPHPRAPAKHQPPAAARRHSTDEHHEHGTEALTRRREHSRSPAAASVPAALRGSTCPKCRTSASAPMSWGAKAFLRGVVPGPGPRHPQDSREFSVTIAFLASSATCGSATTS
ncbi:hypothetical protein SHIRM173S_12583 [Streptomyces hirsutus]